MENRPSVVRLREGLTAFRQGQEAGPALDRDLKDRVCTVVDDLRTLGWPPERVIVAVKQIAEDAGIKASRDVLMLSGLPTPNDDMLQKLVRWCIGHYYGGVTS